MEMGFDEKEVVDALRVNNNQQDAAVGRVNENERKDIKFLGCVQTSTGSETLTELQFLFMCLFILLLFLPHLILLVPVAVRVAAWRQETLSRRHGQRHRHRQPALSGHPGESGGPVGSNQS